MKPSREGEWGAKRQASRRETTSKQARNDKQAGAKRQARDEDRSMNPFANLTTHLTRRHFLGKGAHAVSLGALAALLGRDAQAGSGASQRFGGLPGVPHFAPKAKRIIYLFQSGGPAQLEMFDYKPKLKALHGTELPDSVRKGQRLTGMTSGQ